MGKYSSPESWNRVEELLDEVLGLSKRKQKAFLDSLTGTDALFRPRLEEILQSTPQADELFDKPLLESLVGESEPGSRLGAYRVVRLCGKGGMGEVYEAERADGVYQKRVAIKLLGLGPQRPDMTQRFETERQILANLEHPNIAQLHDGGTTPGGRPYLVMEYVDGRRIDAYCDNEKLSIAQRLHLFVQVCDAVSYAHRHAIVHRDIKPSNILVGKDGKPKLLDFGIAKILANPDATEGRQPMTLAYAAPEQISGNTVTTSLDVFALGAVLFELMTGHRYRPDTTYPPVDSTEKPSVVVQRTPANGSGTLTPESVSKPRSVSPGKLRSLLSGDLDSIVLRAVNGKPEERYASVQAMRDDIERHLEGLPIQARHEETWYRLRCYAGYYRHQVAIAALCLVLMVLGSAGYLQNQKAEIRQQQTLAITQTAFDVFQAKEPVAPGRIVPARELLAQALAELDNSPEQGPFVGLIGSFYVGLGDYDRAAPLLRNALLHMGPEHPLWSYYQTDLNLAESIMSDTQDTGTFPTTTNALPPGSGGAPPRDLIATNEDNTLEYAYYLNNRAAHLYGEGRFARSIVFYEEALDLAVQFEAETETLETIRQNLATSLERIGERGQAVQLLQLVLESRQNTHGHNSQQAGATLQMLAVALLSSSDRADLEQAVVYGEQALAIQASPMHLATLATAERMFLWLPSLDDAARAYHAERAQSLYEQALEGVGDNARGAANIQLGLAILAQEADRYQEAADLTQSAMESLGVYYGEDHWRMAEARSILGGAKLGLGDIEGATTLIMESYDTLLTLRGRDARPTIEAFYRRAQLGSSATN